MFDELRRIAMVGSGVAELTRHRAEQMVKELVKAGDVRREQTQAAVKDMLEMARANRKELLALVRAEIQDQIANLGVANQRDVDRLERRVARLEDENRRLKTDLREAQKEAPAARAAATSPATGSSMAAKRTSPKKTSAKKTTVKKTAGRKTTAAKTGVTSKKTPVSRPLAQPAGGSGRSADAGKPVETGAGE